MQNVGTYSTGLTSPHLTYKNNIVNLLDKVIAADMNKDRWAYVHGIKGLLRMVKADIADEEQRAIEAAYKDLQKQIEAARSSNVPNKETLILDMNYLFYDGLMPRLMDGIQRAKVIMQEDEGIISTDTAEKLAVMAKAIRTGKADDIADGDNIAEVGEL